MSTRMKILTSVSEMVDFIKTKTKSNLVEANRSETLDLDERSLDKILSIVEQSISQAHSQAYTGVERALRDLSSSRE
mgnify:CR=1 FL=1